MSTTSRRRFLQHASTAGLACSTSLLFGRSLSAHPASEPVRIYVDSKRTISPIDRNLFGSFLEHLGRAIYEGISDPGSKLSDSNGFRKDVMEEIRHLGVPIIRYPGGNFVSGYNWLDGVGPKQDRPRVLDRAWNSLNSNQFGTNEFLAWCKAVGTEPLMGLNLGTGTSEQAADLVEYCNVSNGTRWSELRRKHGFPEPYKIQRWCLGNEMDGPWQIGHMSANEYGTKAADAARQMRYVDPSLKLVACGSSGPGMPTYHEWDREVLEQCYEYVDGLSLHRYFENAEPPGGDSAKFLAMNLSMERQIAETIAVCDLVRGHKRSPKKLWLSFDEWNVWYRERRGDAVNGHGKVAPHFYYPYSWALQFARGAALNLLVESSTYNVPGFERVPHVDVAGTLNSGDGSVSLFILNRDLSNAHELEINWEDHAPARVANASVLTGDDLKAFNSFQTPTKVAPQTFTKPATTGTRTKLEVPARSYTVLQWSM